MGFLEEYMRNEAGVDIHAKIEYKGVVVIGTVYQDVHSIGKDLARRCSRITATALSTSA
jgi:5-methyltetrahydrofolate--homocysteine methyltransferase